MIEESVDLLGIGDVCGAQDQVCIGHFGPNDLFRCLQ
jgi:hypothetical protein